MKALSIAPDYAMWILVEDKTIECRTWKTNYRGDILICSTAQKWEGTIPGHALCVVELYDVVPFRKEHLEGACMDEMPSKDSYAWMLRNVRWIKPFPVKGKLSLWECDHPVEIPGVESWSEKEQDDFANEYIVPLIIPLKKSKDR